MIEPNATAVLTELTRALVDIPSVSMDEQAVLDFITERMPISTPLVFESDAVAIFASNRRPNKPLVVLAGHTDTVPIANNVPSTQQDDVITGRGAADMKGALAVMVHLAHALGGNHPANFDVAYLFFGREELPSDQSALLPALDKSDLLRSAELAILMEPTDNALELGCQGNLNLTASFAGIAAHTARPWTGSNAIHNAITALQDVAVLQPNDVDIDGLIFREVANITGARGGVARNVVPDHFEIDVNVRYAPTRNAADAETLWHKRFVDLGARVATISNAPPAPVVGEHPVAQQLLAAGAGAPMPKQAWTNAADFALYGIAALNFGPGDPAYAHKDDEQITTGALTKSFDVLRRFCATESKP